MILSCTHASPSASFPSAARQASFALVPVPQASGRKLCRGRARSCGHAPSLAAVDRIIRRDRLPESLAHSPPGECAMPHQSALRPAQARVLLQHPGREKTSCRPKRRLHGRVRPPAHQYQRTWLCGSSAHSRPPLPVGQELGRDDPNRRFNSVIARLEFVQTRERGHQADGPMAAHPE